MTKKQVFKRGVMRTVRRVDALGRLNQQLESGTKIDKKVNGGYKIALTDKDISRIGREIVTLKARI